jgi:hypothetical protein
MEAIAVEIITTIAAGIVGLAFMVGIAWYLMRTYSSMGGKGLARHYGLAPGERAKYLWLGELDVDISMARRVGTAALGLVAGALLGGVGIATVRAPGLTALLTTHDRLVIVTELDGGAVGRAYFASPREITIRFLGPGPRSIQGGPSVRVELVGPDGVPCPALLHDSAVPYLQQWSSTGVA